MTTASKHTPGAWQLPTTNKGRLPIYIAAPAPEMKSGAVLIAAVGDLANGPIDYRETAATARLIASAPELKLFAEFAITEPGAMSERSHEYALKRLAAITELARNVIAQAEASP